ncbi:patatin-like phospholipase family protein [Labrenzia sp. PHM005]|uniref:patatin-like phospholipase family protein n=1 Tax=Labrenzia sp. PHM005 TaxID=2590016 RepID=UPI0011406229|nr:patatin-like phospholipase family protein [Labrenzia sp. PHM005]QDG77639.1 patatin-like phospholipase family protein [Labrenzia sp. PHM005]
MKRRTFLAGAAASGGTVLTAGGPAAAAKPEECDFQVAKRSDGFLLALGGGAAKAFAHIPVLEALDDLGVKPEAISGTSMGSILGGYYASGMSGKEIRSFTVDLLTQKGQLLQKLFLNDGRTWGSLLNMMRPSIMDPLVLFETLFPDGLAARFEDLTIPLKVIATDFHRQSEVVLTEGPLLPAIAASSALPMLLTPVQIDGKVLIDGGFVNPTPFDVFGQTDYPVVAVDVTGSDFSSINGLPSGMETWIGSFSITLHSLVAAKLACKQPDLLLEPGIGHFQTMDFFDVEDILAAADPIREDVKRGIDQLLGKKI